MNKFILFLLLTVLAACEVQKRKYTGGYAFSKKAPALHTIHEKSGKLTAKKFNDAALTITSLPPDSCDLVHFNDGTKVRVNVIEIDRQVIRYRFCDGDSKVRSTASARVLSIQYSDGREYQKNSAEPGGGLIRIADEPEAQPAVPREPQPVSSQTEETEGAVSDSSNSGNCDRIIFRDGREKKAKILEVGEKEVRYKHCDMENGPVFVENKADVFMIVYKNGSKEVFPEETKTQEVIRISDIPVAEPPPRRKNGLAVLAFIFSIVSIPFFWLFLFGIAAVVISSVYLKKHKEDPKVYTAPRFAKTAFWIGSITSALALALFTSS